MGAPLQHVKCNGVLPVFSSVSLQHAGSRATALAHLWAARAAAREHVDEDAHFPLGSVGRNSAENRFPRGFEWGARPVRIVEH